MSHPPPSAPDCFRVDDRLTILPVVHGSGPYARAVEQWLLQHPCRCLTVPLPPSFGESVCQGVLRLPSPSIVIQPPSPAVGGWDSSFVEGRPDERDESPDDDRDGGAAEAASDEPASSYVPIDPSQSVITAIRFALGEHLPLRFIDLEVGVYEPDTSLTPDPFALREVSLETFAASVMPHLPSPASDQAWQRIGHMAAELRRLTGQFDQVVALCSLQHWPWLRQAYRDPSPSIPSPQPVAEAEGYTVAEQTLLFLLGELPYITGVYEEARQELAVDQQLPAIDGIKRLLMSARASYQADLGPRGRRITPLLLSQCLKYIRNLTLLDRRLNPDLYTLVLAAKQILGDQYAIHLVELARHYPFRDEVPWPEVTLGIDQARLPDGQVCRLANRLAGPPQQWRTIDLKRKPLRHDSHQWQMRWNPYRQCSWPPEDVRIESFRNRVVERARAALGADLARSEKFTTSLMDGLDMRETMRHWYAGDLYVKIQPPSIGEVDACVMLFERQADPRDYGWRTTWFAEHEEESTLAFFATDFRQEMLGPGVAVATYGGAMFLFPPRAIPDIWEDPALDLADTLEDRLVLAACLHAQGKHVALVAPQAPLAAWRRFARRFGKKLVHIPLAQFNDALVQQLRTVHVLNGQEVRSYAAHFIRQA